MVFFKDWYTTTCPSFDIPRDLLHILIIPVFLYHYRGAMESAR
jgi:hypothetical protein